MSYSVKPVLVRICDYMYCCRCIRLVKAGCWMMMKECRPLLLLKVKASNDTRFAFPFLPAYTSDTRSRNLYMKLVAEEACMSDILSSASFFSCTSFLQVYSAQVWTRLAQTFIKIWRKKLARVSCTNFMGICQGVRHISGALLFHFHVIIGGSITAMHATCNAITRCMRIGVASYGALGHVPPRLPTVYFFRSLQSRTNSDIWLHMVAYPVKQYTDQ